KWNSSPCLSNAVVAEHRLPSLCAKQARSMFSFCRLKARCAHRRECLCSEQLAQDKFQDAAVPVVVDFDRGIDLQANGNGIAFPARSLDLQGRSHSRFNCIG